MMRMALGVLACVMMAVPACAEEVVKPPVVSRIGEIPLDPPLVIRFKRMGDVYRIIDDLAICYVLVDTTRPTVGALPMVMSCVPRRDNLAQ